jgi:DNA end-binding protein Ku
VKSKKIAIAKVVIKTRQYLAAVKPRGEALMLELMYFPDELIEEKDFKTPGKKAASAAEVKMANQLIDSMTVAWDPSQYDDDYQNALEKMIEEKLERGEDDEPAAPKPKKKTAKVVDLADILKQSLLQAANRTAHAKKKAPAKKKAVKKKAAAKKRKAA